MHELDSACLVLHEFGESGLVVGLIAIRIGGFPVQIWLGARQGLGSRPCYGACSDPLVEIVQMQ